LNNGERFWWNNGESHCSVVGVALIGVVAALAGHWRRKKASLLVEGFIDEKL
jgi:hypothetical protein